MNRRNDILKLIAAIAVSHAAGIIGSIFTIPTVRNSWYAELNKPAFTPPNWLFSPVWLTLFTLMGIAGWLVLRKGFENSTVRTALYLFLAQLVFNAIWSILFFGMQSPLAAFIEIVFLWVAILLTIIWFFKVSVPAGVLMIPYIIWVSFASILNFLIWYLNR